MSLLGRILEIQSSDPDDARRRRLFGIVSLWLAGACALVLVFYLFAALVNPPVENWDPGFSLLQATVFALFVILFIYFLGRTVSGWVASSSLLLVLTILLFASQPTQPFIPARTTLFFVIPIILSSVLLRPWFSLVAAGVIIAGHFILALNIRQLPDLVALVGMAFVALVSWLVTREVEQNLQMLSDLNKELDRRVTDRTRELSQALSIAYAEGSKSQAILQSITDGVVVYDLHGGVLMSNPALVALTGVSPANVMGRSVTAWVRAAIPGKQGDQVSDLLRWSVSENGRSAAQKQGSGNSSPLAGSLPEMPLNLDLEGRTLALNIASVILDSGERIGAVAVFHDISREVEVSRMKSHFVAMVSHELRTPLSVILGMVEILQTNLYGPTNERQQKLLDRILSNTQRLIRQVGDLLDQAQIEAGTLPLQNAPFSPVDLLANLYETNFSAAQEKKLDLKCSLADEFPDELLGDSHRLNQVLTNLVVNAIKFTDQGQILVHAHTQPLSSKSRLRGPTWSLSVTDTGSGIPETMQDQIFEPFQQVDGSMSRKHGGIGLGLAIVKKLVGLMGGEISLQSQLGAGSTFTVTFPLLLPEPLTAPENTLPAEKDKQPEIDKK